MFINEKQIRSIIRRNILENMLLETSSRASNVFTETILPHVDNPSTSGQEGRISNYTPGIIKIVDNRTHHYVNRALVPLTSVGKTFGIRIKGNTNQTLRAVVRVGSLLSHDEINAATGAGTQDPFFGGKISYYTRERVASTAGQPYAQFQLETDPNKINGYYDRLSSYMSRLLSLDEADTERADNALKEIRDNNEITKAFDDFQSAFNGATRQNVLKGKNDTDGKTLYDIFRILQRPFKKMLDAVALKAYLLGDDNTAKTAVNNRFFSANSGLQQIPVIIFGTDVAGGIGDFEVTHYGKIRPTVVSQEDKDKVTTYIGSAGENNYKAFKKYIKAMFDNNSFSFNELFNLGDLAAAGGEDLLARLNDDIKLFEGPNKTVLDVSPFANFLSGNHKIIKLRFHTDTAPHGEDMSDLESLMTEIQTMYNEIFTDEFFELPQAQQTDPTSTPTTITTPDPVVTSITTQASTPQQQQTVQPAETLGQDTGAPPADPPEPRKKRAAGIAMRINGDSELSLDDLGFEEDTDFIFRNFLRGLVANERNFVKNEGVNIQIIFNKKGKCVKVMERPGQRKMRGLEKARVNIKNWFNTVAQTRYEKINGQIPSQQAWWTAATSTDKGRKIIIPREVGTGRKDPTKAKKFLGIEYNTSEEIKETGGMFNLDFRLF